MSPKVPVPLCDPCWHHRAGFDHPPVRQRNAPSRQCADCGNFTTSGIVVYADPDEVQFPPKTYDTPNYKEHP